MPIISLVTFPPTMSVGRTTKAFLVSLVTSAVFIYEFTLHEQPHRDHPLAEHRPRFPQSPLLA